MAIVCGTVVPAIAADVAQRTDCTTLSARISELSAIENPDDTTITELENLQTTYRRDCAITASNRRSSGRSATLAASAERAATSNAATSGDSASSDLTVSAALSQFLTDKQRICHDLSSNIATLTRGGATTEDLQPLVDQYHIDCMGERTATSDNETNNTADTTTETSESVDVETAAANVAAGLCTDGSKPNRFGCCAGETFKDLGNLVLHVAQMMVANAIRQ